MKYSTLILLLVIAAYSTRAQSLQINAPDKEYYAYTVYDLDTITMNEGGSGQGVTWDFSKVALTPPVATKYFLPAKNSPFFEYFPTAQYVEKREDNKKHNFMIMGKEYLAEIGSVNLEDSIIKDYFSIDTTFHYPLYFGKKWTIDGRNKEKNLKNKLNATQTFFATFEIDGEGTILLPNGISYSSLRLKVIVDFDGYAYKPNAEKYSYNKKTHREAYLWYIKDMPITEVYTIRKSSESLYNYSGRKYHEQVKKECSFHEPIEKNNNIPSNNTLQLSTIQNENNIQISYTLHNNSEGEIKIYNASGVVIKRVTITSSETNIGSNTVSLPTNDIATGVYIIVLNTKKESSAIKWVKK